MTVMLAVPLNSGTRALRRVIPLQPRFYRGQRFEAFMNKAG
ncbi:MAG: hypothetical protein QME51_00250 [Planctomycetota bacterium]|nr:hypothetical protein [Planctomycetota bacterium]MDI6786790.1 hypothetical protein [Planctomycetota bacterium]